MTTTSQSNDNTTLEQLRLEMEAALENAQTVDATGKRNAAELEQIGERMPAVDSATASQLRKRRAELEDEQRDQESRSRHAWDVYGDADAHYAQAQHPEAHAALLAARQKFQRAVTGVHESARALWAQRQQTHSVFARAGFQGVEANAKHVDSVLKEMPAPARQLFHMLRDLTPSA